MAIITISRQCGSLGDELCSYMASKLGCTVISRDYVMDKIFSEFSTDEINKLNESPKSFLNSIPDSDITYKDLLISSLHKITSSQENIIILGLGGFEIFGKLPDSINIRVISSDSVRLSRIGRKYNISSDEASAMLSTADKKHKRFVSTVFGSDLTLQEHYDLIINTDSLSIEEASYGVISLISAKNLRTRIISETVNNNSVNHQTSTPVFKNDTEAEFAKILDMYGIEWIYEPKTFPVEWDAEGNVISAFSPDFYLPKFDLYLELTTMDQKYVTKKNKKVRLVKELYPGTNVRIVYKKDFAELVERLKNFG